MKWIDLPPVWLLACLGLTHGLRGASPAQAVLELAVLRVAGAICMGLGVVLMILAVLEMRRHNTTVIPHLTAARLVRSGIFARSRNPIYLGDMLVLLGFIMWTGTILAVPLLYGLYVILRTRFIIPEESRLAAKFGDDFAEYTRQTGRWW